MNARELETAAAALEKSARRGARLLFASATLGVLALAAAPVSPAFAVALGAGAALELVASAMLWLRRRERIERLALEPSAYVIPAVARFGNRLCGLGQRRQLAASIHSVVGECQPLDLHLFARTGRFARQLEALADELAAPAASVEPVVAVACRRLLTRPVESPLYNPNLSDEDLRALLLRIRAGISAGLAG